MWKVNDFDRLFSIKFQCISVAFFNFFANLIKIFTQEVVTTCSFEFQAVYSRRLEELGAIFGIWYPKLNPFQEGKFLNGNLTNVRSEQKPHYTGKVRLCFPVVFKWFGQNKQKVQRIKIAWSSKNNCGGPKSVLYKYKLFACISENTLITFFS